VIADPAWATEVGQFNLEINVPPRQLDGDAVRGLLGLWVREETARLRTNA